MVGSGTLDALLEKGFKYMFVSNSDNLGATMDLKLLTWFAGTSAPFAMECAQRTDADKKGGHLAQDASPRAAACPKLGKERSPSELLSPGRWAVRHRRFSRLRVVRMIKILAIYYDRFLTAECMSKCTSQIGLRAASHFYT